MDKSGKISAPDVLPQLKNPGTHLVIWSQSQSGWFWKTENPLPLQGSQTQTIELVACNYADYDVRGKMIFADFKAIVLKILVL